MSISPSWEQVQAEAVSFRQVNGVILLKNHKQNGILTAVDSDNWKKYLNKIGGHCTRNL